MGQHLRRSHESALLAGPGGGKQHQCGDHRLAGAHVTVDQPVGRLGPAQVFEYLAHHPLLRPREGKGQDAAQLVQGPARVQFGVLAHRLGLPASLGQPHLQRKQLVVGQPGPRCAQGLAVGREVHLAVSLRQRHQVARGDEFCRNPLLRVLRAAVQRRPHQLAHNDLRKGRGAIDRNDAANVQVVGSCRVDRCRVVCDGPPRLPPGRIGGARRRRRDTRRLVTEWLLWFWSRLQNLRFTDREGKFALVDADLAGDDEPGADGHLRGAVGLVEPCEVDAVRAVCGGHERELLVAPVHQAPRARDREHQAGGLAVLQAADRLRLPPVFIAEGVALQQVADGDELVLQQGLRPRRPDARKLRQRRGPS